MSPGQRQETRIHRPRKRGASPSGASHRPPEGQGKPPILRMRRLRPGQGTRLLYEPEPEPGQAWNAGTVKEAPWPARACGRQLSVPAHSCYKYDADSPVTLAAGSVRPGTGP